MINSVLTKPSGEPKQGVERSSHQKKEEVQNIWV